MLWWRDFILSGLSGHDSNTAALCVVLKEATYLTTTALQLHRPKTILELSLVGLYFSISSFPSSVTVYLHNVLCLFFMCYLCRASDSAPASLPPLLLFPHHSTASSPALPHAPLCRLPSWRVVSVHEQTHWWDQLSISSHKRIDLIHQHTHSHVSCTAAPLCPVGLREIRGSQSTPWAQLCLWNVQVVP